MTAVSTTEAAYCSSCYDTVGNGAAIAAVLPRVACARCWRTCLGYVPVPPKAKGAD